MYKKSIALLLAGFLTLPTLFAQVNLNRIKNKASQALGDAIDRKIEQELNKAADRVVNKYWDRVIGKYYGGLYDDSLSEGGFPFILSEDVELADSYSFQRIVKIEINTYKKNGKLKESMMMNTHTATTGDYMGTQIEDNDSKKKDQFLFIINDFNREAFVMIMESEGEKSRLAYKMELNEQAITEEVATDVKESDDEDMPTSNTAYEDLGTKTVNGYSCHGYGYTNATGYTEVWVTEEDVFGMGEMFNINKSRFEKDMGTLPDNYPTGSVMELVSIDSDSKEKTVMQVVEIIEHVDIEYQMSDYPAIGSEDAAE